MATALIETAGLCKYFGKASSMVRALQDVTLRIEREDFVAIMGASGSGKSTFMHIVGCLAAPSAGTYLLDGIDTCRLSSTDLARTRNREIGFVFQSFNLLPRFSVLHNVELPMVYAAWGREQRRERAQELLRTVGLADRMDHCASELSGGQQQRVAIARALVNSPKLLLADEPTGALDSQTGTQIMELFQRLNRDGITIVLVTHDAGIASYANRTLLFHDGRVVDQ